MGYWSVVRRLRTEHGKEGREQGQKMWTTREGQVDDGEDER